MPVYRFASAEALVRLRDGGTLPGFRLYDVIEQPFLQFLLHVSATLRDLALPGRPWVDGVLICLHPSRSDEDAALLGYALERMFDSLHDIRVARGWPDQ